MPDHYRIARQAHVGDALDDLVERGEVYNWEFQYDYDRKRALFLIIARGSIRALQTREAEEFVQKQYDRLDVVWKPVPHPGGERQRSETLKWIARNS